MEESSKNEVEDGFNTNPGKEGPKRVHLFNCDNTYNLDSVEELFCEVKDDIRKKLNFDIELPIRKNYFPLSKMSEMCETTIPKLQMNLAVFVVHAHESGLKINGDSPGFGYTRFYRALLEATGENVLVVIGGDDQYSNTNEEERFVISRWARRMISSQFRQEFMDGRRSFIFSWNKKHRAVHGEALLHFFDPSKKGQKFEYQPKHHSEVSSRGKESEAENKNQEQEIKDNGERRDEKPSNEEQGPDDVGDDKGLPGEADYFRLDFKREEFEVFELPDANKTEVEAAANNTGAQHDVETLLAKTRLRYGQLSGVDKNKMVKQWTPPDELLSTIFNKFKNVAEADMEIYGVEETGVIRIKIIDNTGSFMKPFIYAVIEIVSNIIYWITDNTWRFLQLAGSSEGELKKEEEAEEVRAPVIREGDTEGGFAIVDIAKE